MFANLWFDLKVDVAPVAGYRNDHADSDGKEHEPCFSEIKAIHVNVYERKGFKERVVYAVH